MSALSAAGVLLVARAAAAWAVGVVAGMVGVGAQRHLLSVVGAGALALAWWWTGHVRHRVWLRQVAEVAARLRTHLVLQGACRDGRLAVWVHLDGNALPGFVAVVGGVREVVVDGQVLQPALERARDAQAAAVRAMLDRLVG